MLNRWARAAVEAHAALGHAAACLPPEADADRAGPGKEGPTQPLAVWMPLRCRCGPGGIC